jgi:hypothetical protein
VLEDHEVGGGEETGPAHLLHVYRMPAFKKFENQSFKT